MLVAHKEIQYVSGSHEVIRHNEKMEKDIGIA